MDDKAEWQEHTKAADFAETNPVQNMLSQKAMMVATEEALADIGGHDCPLKLQTWHLLLLPLQAPKESSGGIILTDTAVQAMENNNYVAKIVKMGPKSFQVERMRCKDPLDDDGIIPREGDWVLVSRLSGQRIKYKGVSMNTCTDDAVIMVVDDPTDCYVMV